jgi:hypothetical protein
VTCFTNASLVCYAKIVPLTKREANWQGTPVGVNIARVHEAVYTLHLLC